MVGIRFFLFYIFIFSLFIDISADIKELDRFNNIKDSLQDKAWVILDIDNTIIKPDQTLGSDQWFESVLKNYIKNEESFDIALQKSLELWHKVISVSNYSLVEHDIADIIKEIQRDYYVFAVTARGFGIAATTVSALNKVGVDLSLNSIANKEVLLFNPNPVLFYKGILFCGGSDKGEAIFSLCKEIQVLPEKIIFVDDKLKSVQQVEKAAIKYDFDYIGLRYSYLDKYIENLNHDIAKIQLEKFYTPISDEQAILMLNKN